MKKLKKLATLLLAAALMLAPLAGNAITAEAAEAAAPTTYYVKYVDSLGEWRFQLNTWDDTKSNTHMYYLTDTIKDGDIIVVDSFSQQLRLNLDVRLSNLTLLHGNAVISAKGIDECQVLLSSYCAINADVTTAFVGSGSICNFNGNVQDLTISYADSQQPATIGVTGTVGTLTNVDEAGKVRYNCYNFKTGTFSFANGVVTTDAGNYSTTAPATTPSTSAPTGGTTGEYDDVPKTGQWSPVWMLLAAAAVCFMASRKLRHS